MMMRTIFISLVAIAQVTCSCSKKEGAPAGNPTNPGGGDPVYVQYGTPFGAVPDAANATIYQVNMRAFSSQHNFNGVKARLDSMKALGINVVYLMPVYPVGTTRAVNSPYCIKDFTAVNSEFGTLDDLRQLVAAAHDKGMAVIMDWVANHTSWDHPWVTEHKSWYQQDAGGTIIHPPGTNWADVAELNYSQADMRKAMIAAMKYWVYTANIDGYRCDAADFVPADFWRQAIDSLRNISTHKLLLFAEGTRNDHFVAGFNLVYGMGFYYHMVNNIYRGNTAVTSLDNINTTEYTNSLGNEQVVRYTSNHDVNNSDGTPLDLLGGKAGSLAAFITAAYLKGVPMIYNGQEVACPTRLTYFNSTTTVDWTLNADVTATYKRILAYRNNTEALRKGTLVTYNSNDVCAFTKELGGKKVVVLVNLRNSAVNYTVPAALVNTNWKNVFDGTNAAVTIGTHVALQPYEYKIIESL